MPDPFHLASALSEGLARLPGVAAVVLGGSQATGEADQESDIDIGIYYRHESPPDVEALQSFARQVDDRGSEAHLTRVGEWGPWINGGAWLVVKGQRVDWLYRDVGDVQLAISSARAGLISSHYQPGHPHAFHNYIYAGEVHYARPLYDGDGVLDALKQLTDPYPPELKEAIVKKFLWEGRFSLDTARKSAARGDVTYVAGCIYRTAMCLVQVLFAANGRYCINEKRAVTTAGSLPLSPPGFASTITDCWTGLVADPVGLGARLDGLEQLTTLVAELVERNS